MGQHLFTVYVHPGPKYAGYPLGNLFHGREVADRVQVTPHAHTWHVRGSLFVLL